MSSDLEIKLAELAKDYQNLKERHSEFLLEVKSHNADTINRIKDLTENISDLYNQIEQTRIEGDINNTNLLEKIKTIDGSIKKLQEDYKELDELIKSSLWNRLMKELSDSKLIPIIKTFFWIALIFLAAKGLIPAGWIKF